MPRDTAATHTRPHGPDAELSLPALAIRDLQAAKTGPLTLADVTNVAPHAPLWEIQAAARELLHHAEVAA
jgi:hypothetical protein